MSSGEDDRQGADDDVVRRVDEVTWALDDLCRTLEREERLPEILDRLCRQIVHAIPEADMASVSMLRDGVPETVAATGDHAIEIDKAQYVANEGPCLEAATAGATVRVVVAEVRDRWPAFVEVAGRAAVSSYLSAPLFLDSEYHGSLNLYGSAPHGFGKLDAALLALYTTAAEAALHGARRYLLAREQTEHLRTALVTRAVIDQAKGVIMAVRRIPAEQAFELLVSKSQEENVKVREIAERFIRGIVEGD
ncbi:GAF and ANTAR domain-containing protein [Saccharothrix mutabilis subsp. mutabilis]|uniref:GAF and ANTAR domain-containing protein n=1 Tax=Saccharothrix mutabilis subsp. mutabilis TaxID=66855 RepID=A0ABN0UID7_9PSEU